MDGLDNTLPPRLALSHYSKAVAELRSRMEGCASQPVLEIVLLVCLIFVGFEMLLYDVNVAMTHLHKGLRIIEDDRNTDQFHSKVGIRGLFSSNRGREGSLNELISTFVRLDYVSLS